MNTLKTFFKLFERVVITQLKLRIELSVMLPRSSNQLPGRVDDRSPRLHSVSFRAKMSSYDTLLRAEFQVEGTAKRAQGLPLKLFGSDSL